MSLQVRAELSIADHVWQKKRQAIADSVDSLGDQFRPLFRAGWLAYINKTYGAKRSPDKHHLLWLLMVD